MSGQSSVRSGGAMRTPPVGSASEWWVLVALLVGAWALRVAPFLSPSGVVGWPVDYDEGVYVAGAQLLARGALPWRDFAFVHPPGILYALAPFTLLEPRSALIAARVAMTFVGTLNVALVFLAVRPRGGLSGAVVGAALYAAWPEVVYADRRVLIEPLLSLFCLLAIQSLAVAPDAEATTPSRGAPRWLAGLMLGLALAVKSWAVLWFIGALSAAPSPRVAMRWLMVALGTFALVTGWLLLADTGAAWDMLIRVHLARPPDGDLSRLIRLREMFVARSVVPIVTLAVTAPWLLKNAGTPVVRALGATFSLLVAAFMASAAWWNQYDAHLATVMAPLVGLGVGMTLEAWRVRVRLAGAVVLGGLAAIPGVREVSRSFEMLDPDQTVRAHAIARVAPPDAAVCAFDVEDVLLANRWPSPPVDSYGQGLADATRGGHRYPSTGDAFATEESQHSLRAQLERCDVVVRGWRGEAQMNGATKAWLDRTFQAREPEVFLRRSVQPAGPSGE